MTTLIAAVAALVVALVQVTWAPRLALLGAFPNLVLVFVVVMAWTRGQRAGLVWACVGGLLLDLTSAGALGPHALALLCGAYLTGFWVRNVDPSRWLQAVLATAASTVAYSLVLVGADNLLDQALPPLNVAIALTATAAVYNAVVVVPVLLVALARGPALRPGT